MLHRSEERIAHLFAARARDVTPAQLRGGAHVLYLPALRDEGMTRHFGAILSEAERQRASRFANAADTTRFVQRRAFRRFCGATALGVGRPLASITFEETSIGRPHLADAPNLRFGFSSCRSGILGTWSSTHELGVDIEDRTQNLNPIDIAEMYFTEREARAVATSHGPLCIDTFLLFWCLKEAALKSIDQGLPYGLDAFVFDLSPALRVVRAPACHGGPASFTPYRLDGTGACAALVVHHRPQSA